MTTETIEPITVHDVLGHLETVLAEVAAACGMTAGELRSKQSRRRRHTRARVGFYLRARSSCECTMEELGEVLHRDHTSVSNIRKVAEERTAQAGGTQ